MQTRPKVLLVDDDPDLLELYRELLARLPSNPEIRTANTGLKALAFLEEEPFHLFLCDLKMPKMDGLQVLAVVRRKYPQLRTVALTALTDESLRSRVYALGVDLYWQKPANEREVQLFLDSLESLLSREASGGFRGVQSKSLVDLLQLECLSQNSTVLRVTNGPWEGRIWILRGELIDAETEGLVGEEAFAHILSWKSGTFEQLPPDPDRPQRIFKSCNALLLETAQAMDESGTGTEPPGEPEIPSPPPPLEQIARMERVSAVLRFASDPAGPWEGRGIEYPEQVRRWAQHTLDRYQRLGEKLAVGPLEQVQGWSWQQHVGLAPLPDGGLMVEWHGRIAPDRAREQLRKAVALLQP
ncbi:response regulator [Limisphaera ngatamarikiensis]|uniref:Response regulator n=1 Tax=Limisphaera ngatamarikiensis TaxID=1324935 RepID=A0A6M1S077_9BACT|nr:response regulator [Limisphaera ngatamarikiensis]NGO40402.1 response regulator [Limisphaera ngatamarikiensis]